MQYWDDLITSQSWLKLQEINKKYNFVLIGGWAVFIYTKALKSKDIDIIVDFETLTKLKQDFHLNKNERLKKYEIKELQFDIDVYVEYYSNIGLPVEQVVKNSVKKDGFLVPKIELLLILKQIVFKQRQDSLKGQKDKIDLFSLLQQDMDIGFYKKLLKKYQFKTLRSELIDLLQETVEFKEIGLNRQKISRLKKRVVEQLN
jgi:hypothetical protein